MARLEIELDPSGASTGARVIKRDLRDIADHADRTTKATDRLGTRTERSMKRAGVATRGFEAAANRARLGVIALGAAVAAAVAKGFQSALGLDRALSEASTLLQGTTEEMALMRKEAIAMSSQFGGSTTQQVQAFYQAISAGAGTVEEATSLLQTSNQLAKGGVTSVTQAVDVLTTATNAYKQSNLTAANASDILFAGVKAGKTTVAELGSALGKIVPISAQLGVGFDEVVAATASLTLNGLSTSEAITGLRGAMSGILKPTKEASDLAKELGLEFNTTALKAKGFVGFLQDIIDKTGGNSDALAKLFGSVEGLAAVMALVSGEGKQVVSVLDDVRDSAGATQEAADKVSKALSDRLFVALGKVGKAFEFIGTILLNTVVPALELVVKAGDLVVSAFVKVGTDLSAVFKFISRETVIVAAATDDWTSAVDMHNQSERDLKNALDLVDGSSKAAADRAKELALANLALAESAQVATQKELELARALITASRIEQNRQWCLHPVDNVNRGIHSVPANKL